MIRHAVRARSVRPARYRRSALRRLRRHPDSDESRRAGRANEDIRREELRHLPFRAMRAVDEITYAMLRVGSSDRMSSR